MNIGIRDFTGLKDGKALIDAHTKNDIEILNSQFRNAYGYRLETNLQKRRNPRLITYNITDEVKPENAEEIIFAQNTELALKKGDTTTKFFIKSKRNSRNLVTNLTPQTRRLMLQRN